MFADTPELARRLEVQLHFQLGKLLPPGVPGADEANGNEDGNGNGSGAGAGERVS